MSVIDEVKQRTDIIEVAGQYTSLAKSGLNFKGICPFHSEKHPSFFIYPEQQSWHCFGACNTGGDVFSLIMKKEGLDFGETLRRSADKAGITLPARTGFTADKEKNERLYKINELASDYFHQLLTTSPSAEKTRGYVKKRGISPNSITAFKLGYSPNSWDSLKQYLLERDFSEVELLTAGLIIKPESTATHDRFRNRLMFPINDIKGRTIGFGARVLDDSMPKYTNSPDTPLFYKSSCLYGIDLAREAIRQQDMAVIVEGYMDVITAYDNGFSNVIASMGTSITDKQVNVLKKLTRDINIILALDADTAGEKATLRSLGYENLLNTEIKVAILPNENDPDDIIKEDKEAWQHIINKATSIFDYVLERNISGFNLSTMEGKYSTIESFLSLLKEVQDKVTYRHSLKKLHMSDHYTKKLADLTGSSHQEMKNYISTYLKTQPSDKLNQDIPSRVKISPFSNPREEYCLALLLQHPELKSVSDRLMPEYFENSENREIFNTYRLATDVSFIKDKLDSTVWEHFDGLITKKLLSDKVEERFYDCISRLQEEYLRRLERKRAVVFASEEASGGSPAVLNRLKEQDIDVSSQLRNIFSQRSRGIQMRKRNG